MRDAPQKRTKASLAKGKLPLDQWPHCEEYVNHLCTNDTRLANGTLRSQFSAPIPDSEWTGSQSKFNRYQDGIPRIYCACGTRVMLIRFVRRSGGAAGDQELYLYLQRNGLMVGNFCKLRLCWFCTRAEKITLDMVDRLAHSAGIAARPRLAGVDAATPDAQRADRAAKPHSKPRVATQSACARKKRDTESAKQSTRSVLRKAKRHG